MGMTREELKAHCEKQIRACEMWAHSQGERPCGKIYEEHKLILELLKQEPCEDWCDVPSDEMTLEQARQAVKDLRKIWAKHLEQEPKTGHWITRPHVYGVTYCSECDFELKIDNTNYCPNCGADMRKVEE